VTDDDDDSRTLQRENVALQFWTTTPTGIALFCLLSDISCFTRG